MKSYKKVLFFRKRMKVYIAKAPAHTWMGSYDYWMPLPPFLEGVNVYEEGTTQDQGKPSNSHLDIE